MSEVYPPSEDTALLASTAREAERAAEIGCGSGAATRSIAAKASYLVATDISPSAARETYRRLRDAGLLYKVDVVVADKLAPFRDRVFDVIYCNPPYLPCSYEEEPLWCGGERGIEYSLALAREAATRLTPGGCLVLLASTLADTESMLRELRSLFMKVAVLEERPMGMYESLLVVEACSPRKCSAK